MKKYLFLGAALAAATPAAAQSPSLLPFPGLASPTESTQSFRAEALRSDAYEIESSRIALQRSRSPRVRSYASQMIRDHQATTNALLPEGYSLNATGNVVSDNKGGPFNSALGILTSPLTVPVNLVGDVFEGKSLIDNEPATPGRRVALDPRRQQQLQGLATTRPRDFNATYTNQQVLSHRDAVTLYSGYAANGDDEQGRTFANQALPSLQTHLQDADRLSAQFGETDPAF